jgi:hypothetical protein
MRLRKPVFCIYDSYRRELCPIILSQSAKIALANQFGGQSKSGLPRGGRWRCLSLSGVSNAERTLARRLPLHPSRNEGQGADLLETRGWEDVAGGVVEGSYSASSCFLTAASWRSSNSVRRRPRQRSAARMSAPNMSFMTGFSPKPLAMIFSRRSSTNSRSRRFVTGMRITVPAYPAGIALILAYGVTIRDEGHREHVSGQADPER